MSTVSSILAEYGFRSIYTLVLAALAIAFAVEIWRLWADDRLSIGTFDSSEGGKPVEGGGESFARLIEQQHHRIAHMYRNGKKSALPSRWQLDQRLEPNVELSVPPIASVRVPEAMIEIQGVNVTALLTALRRWVRRPNEISGTLSKFENELFVDASWPTAPPPKARQGPGSTGRDRPTEGRTWAESYDNPQNAAFDLSCRIFWTQAAASGEPLLLSVSEDDFCTFTRAWRAYQLHLAGLESHEGEGEPPTDKLVQAKRLATRLVDRKIEFPFAYQLRAFVALGESGGDPTPEQLQSMIGWLDASLQRTAHLGMEDPPTKALRDELALILEAKQKVEKRSTEDGAVAMTAGSSIGEEKGGAASVCCFVERGGKRYLLTADYVLSAGKDVQVLHPAPLDGGKTPVSSSVEVTPLGEDPASGIALAELRRGVGASNEIEGIRLQKVSGATPGSTLRFFGRTSGLQEFTLLSADVAQASLPSRDWSRMLVAGPVTKAGDGGGPVMDEAGGLVGMIYGSSDQYSFILPLEPVFDELGLKLVGAAGVDQTPTPIEEDRPAEEPPSLPVQEERADRPVRRIRPVVFDVDSAKLDANARRILEDAAELILQRNVAHVEIRGFADSTGDAGHNKDLSQRRADAVRDFLVKRKVEQSRLESTGFGSDSRYSNDTDEGRLRNRRAEVHLTIEPGAPDR